MRQTIILIAVLLLLSCANNNNELKSQRAAGQIKADNYANDIIRAATIQPTISFSDKRHTNQEIYKAIEWAGVCQKTMAEMAYDKKIQKEYEWSEKYKKLQRFFLRPVGYFIKIFNLDKELALELATSTAIVPEGVKFAYLTGFGGSEKVREEVISKRFEVCLVYASDYQKLIDLYIKAEIVKNMKDNNGK